MFTTVTMDNGVVVMIGGGWNLPPSYPNYCSTWIEITGTEGALILDDTQRDHWLNTVKDGQQFPMSTMPGEQVDHVFAGGMGPETMHFLEACIRNTPVMVTPESARAVMEAYTAADLSADRNEPVDLPLTNETIAAVADFKAKFRTGDNVAARHENASQGHRPRHHRRRPRRPVPRRGGEPPSGGEVDRPRREEPEPRRRGRAARSAPISSRRATSSCSSGRR